MTLVDAAPVSGLAAIASLSVDRYNKLQVEGILRSGRWDHLYHLRIDLTAYMRGELIYGD